MADSKNSFESIIHADRARKKNEDLANQIFGRSKASQNVKKMQKDNEPRSPSLASRMGVQKRHSSTSTPTRRDSFNPPSRPSSTTPSHRNNKPQSDARASRIANEIDSGNANISTSTARTQQPKPARNGTSQAQQGGGLTIKGSAGPFTIHASNFDPDTTQADIESALAGDLYDESGNNCLVSCRLLATRPSVIAEMVLTEKSIADRIVSKFNNLKADGRILKVEHVRAASSNPSRKNTAANNSVTQSVEPTVAATDVPMVAAEGDMEMDEVDVAADYPSTTPYDHEREAADRDRRDRDRNRDGYTGSRRDDDRRDERPREDRDRRRDDRDRERDRAERPEDMDRDRERERERDRGDRDRDRDYDRRDPQSQSQQPQPYNSYPQRGSAPTAYGNGYNRPYRGGGGYGGRGYGFQRGGYGGSRGGGGYRGGYSR